MYIISSTFHVIKIFIYTVSVNPIIVYLILSRMELHAIQDVNSNLMLL